MASIPKIIGVVSCGVLMCLSLSNATQARERMKPDPCAERKGGQPNLVKCDEETRQGIDTIKGEVLRVEGSNYAIQRFNGEEMLLHVDATTQSTGIIGRGDRIEAKVGEVDNQKHVLSIREIR
jgi:hypothetical protein